LAAVQRRAGQKVSLLLTGQLTRSLTLTQPTHVSNHNSHDSGANTHFNTKHRSTAVWLYIENWSLDNWLRLEKSGSSVALQYNITFLTYISLKVKYL